MNNIELICKHNYETVVKKVQEWKSNYEGTSRGTTYTTLTQEQIYIFCNKCGESKRIDINPIELGTLN